MKPFFISCILAAFPLPAIAAEFAHCYLGEAPADAPLSTGPNQAGLFFSVQVASLKHACGDLGDDDRALLSARIAEGQCSETSEIAAYVADSFKDTPEVARAALLSSINGDEAFLNQLCAAAKTCIAGETEYDAACKSTIDKAVSP